MPRGPSAPYKAWGRRLPIHLRGHPSVGSTPTRRIAPMGTRPHSIPALGGALHVAGNGCFPQPLGVPWWVWGSPEVPWWVWGSPKGRDPAQRRPPLAQKGSVALGGGAMQGGGGRLEPLQRFDAVNCTPIPDKLHQEAFPAPSLPAAPLTGWDGTTRTAPTRRNLLPGRRGGCKGCKDRRSSKKPPSKVQFPPPAVLRGSSASPAPLGRTSRALPSTAPLHFTLFKCSHHSVAQ